MNIAIASTVFFTFLWAGTAAAQGIAAPGEPCCTLASSRFMQPDPRLRPLTSAPTAIGWMALAREDPSHAAPRLGVQPDSGTSRGQRLAFGVLGGVIGAVPGFATSDRDLGEIGWMLGSGAGVLLATSQREGMNPVGVILGTGLGALPLLTRTSDGHLTFSNFATAIMVTILVPIGATFGSELFR